MLHTRYPHARRNRPLIIRNAGSSIMPGRFGPVLRRGAGLQSGRAGQYRDNPPLCPDFGFVNLAEYAGGCQKYGLVISYILFIPGGVRAILPGMLDVDN